MAVHEDASERSVDDDGFPLRRVDREETHFVGVPTRRASCDFSALSSQRESPRSILVQPDDKRAKTRRRSVSFSTVSVNVHPVVLGDNPAVSKGLPVTIGHLPIHCSTQEIDRFENDRKELGIRRSKKQMRLSQEKRTMMLLAQGHSEGSFRRVQSEIQAIKQHRQEAAFNDASARSLSKEGKQLFSRIRKR